MKIGDFINTTDKALGIKVAFVPPPQVAQTQEAFGQVSQMMQQLPPEVQQQIAPQLEQVQQLPPEQQMQVLQQIMQGMQQQQQASQPTGEQVQQGQEDPSQADRSMNELDSKTVTLTVRELMDLTSGGKATQSHLKVKQMLDSHNQKMDQVAKQQQMDEQKQQAEMQAQSQVAQQNTGGLYPVAPDMSGKLQQ